MYPSLLAEETKQAVTEYLSTTFALADEDARAALEEFLLDRDTGIFRGPYLRVRTPFQRVRSDWPSPLDWLPMGFQPYRHQARAFERLAGGSRSAAPTIITTGTGSGKTEAFLYPVLDHARRARLSGETGIKAIVLYPMNALVTDQARRIAELLHDDHRLHDVTAGVYIGGAGQHTRQTREHVVSSRQALRENPPDILLTNYKMLDLLLLRPADAPLWEASRSSLRYLVLDEFHTYDGAQGTDVAMLLRRLGATLQVAEPGRPLGRITPVATSATLGGHTRAAELRSFAETVFGTPFAPDSIITEERLEASEVVPDVDELTIPPVVQVNEISVPNATETGSWQALAHAFLGGAIGDELALGRRLSRNLVTRAVVEALATHPRTLPETVEAVTNSDLLHWGVHSQQDRNAVEQAILRFLALLSAARVDAGHSGRTRPLLDLEVQLWIRELGRMLRAVDTTPRFAWWHDGQVEEQARYLPAAYCRVCGRSGWQALATELGEELDGVPDRVWRASVTDSARLRTLLLAHEEEPGARRIDPHTLVYCRDGEEGLSVLVTPNADAAEAQRCPSCDSDDGIRFLGSSVATLVSVALTQLFGSGLIEDGAKKTLVFTDSVQDAAHRAAFIEGRAFQFNLRSAILRAVGTEPRSLQQVATTLADSSADDLYAIAPPDFTRRLGLTGEWLNQKRGGYYRRLLGTRLAFQTHLELGLRSRLGRTLELTGTLGVDYDIDLDSYVALARETHANLPEHGYFLPEETAYRTWILGILDRLRRHGGIAHRWLQTYIHRDGNRYPIWGGSPEGMQKFPKGRPAPTFFSTARGAPFQSLRPRGDSWLTDWTERCLGVSRVEARALIEPVVRLLAEGESAPLVQRTSKSDAAVFGVDPAKIVLVPLDHTQLHHAQLRCPQCHHIQPTTPERMHLWQEAPCPRTRCGGRLHPHPMRDDDFYRALYRSGRLRHLVTHEHTALLEDETRQQVERSFAQGESPIDTNVLTCTPTLELGIDIGDLSTVGLASLPHGPASYLQRVGRAGRSSGNALVLATVPNSPRDLYYLSEPKHLIDGEIAPPAAYLSATELLCRQYFAYCLDRLATGDITLGRELPQNLGLLLEDGLEEGSWLRRFVDVVTARAERLAEQFLALYGDTLDESAHRAIHDFAAAGLREACVRTVEEWSMRRAELHHRRHELSQAIADLDRQGHLDDTQREDRRRWAGEFKAVGLMLHQDQNQDTLTGLGKLSLLPNYNLRDDHAELDVSLWWTTDDEGETGPQVSEHTYGRVSKTAITEFAPGAVFYAQGYRVQIDALEIGPAGQPYWRRTRLCPDCGWGTTAVDPAPGQCPRCGTTAVADTGAVHHVLELQRVSAVHRRDEAVIEDETDDRVRTPFVTVTGVDVDPEQIQRAWRLKDRIFGAEYVRQATIRTLNLGQRDRPGGETAIAGERMPATRFPTCVYCGVVRQGPEERVRHRGWCSTRRGVPVQWQDLVLSHQITTQAVRLLLPVSTFRIEERLTSLKTALLLGLRRDFGGDPQHLDVITARMPDEHRRTRQFLVLHDTVPGGTGYLDRLGDPERMHQILSQAYEAVNSCSCRFENRLACHRCLLGVATHGEVAHANREVALDLLAELLEDWATEDIGTVTQIDISSLQKSELEFRFSEELKRAIDTTADESWSSSMGNRGEELDIRLRGPDGSPRRWAAQPLVQLNAAGVATEVDVRFTRQDAQDVPVAVYLDGKAYHASPEHNRTADDAHKRAALRDEDLRVWALTWDDVDDFAQMLDGYQSKTNELVPSSAQSTVRRQVAEQRASVLWGNPMQALLAYLRDPDAEIWENIAVYTLFGLISAQQESSAGHLTCSTAELPAALTAWTAAQAEQNGLQTSPERLPRGEGAMLVARTGLSGLPIAVVGTVDTPHETIGALALLDDRSPVVGGSEHDLRWREWLRWSNLLQFLRLPRHGRSKPMRMAECWTRESLELFRARTVPLAGAGTGAASPIDVVPPRWQLVLDYTDPLLEKIGTRLAALEIPEPEAGGEVGDTELWQVEYCWPEQRLAVTVESDPERDDWLNRNGWQLFLYGPEGRHGEEELVQILASVFGGARS